MRRAQQLDVARVEFGAAVLDLDDVVDDEATLPASRSTADALRRGALLVAELDPLRRVVERLRCLRWALHRPRIPGPERRLLHPHRRHPLTKTPATGLPGGRLNSK